MEEKTMLKLLIITIVILVASVIGNILLYSGYMAADLCTPSKNTTKESVMPESISYLDYSGAYLEGADLSGINAYKAILAGADMRNADLHGAKFTLADLTGADLSGADLIGTKLDYSVLRGANLKDADLSYADLRGADLTNADLTGAVIEGADLRWIKGEYTR
ncbi:MAG: pentapeptide repeat-containing protein [Methanomicrobiaceae archaeon]|nr:pentapeptide repeat-containing protein [Methanomicrobiaceae archaeon]